MYITNENIEISRNDLSPSSTGSNKIGAEIGMIPKTADGASGWQFCNLVEINCGKVESEDDFYDVCCAASFAATIQATYDSFPFLGKTTEQIVRGSALIGVSITGYMDCPIELTPEILRKGAEYVKKTNFETAHMLGIMPARRCTTMKPSGNASILLETEPASSPAHSKKYLRHVRVSKHRGMYSFIKRNMPQLIVCDNEVIGSHETGSAIIAFPIRARKGKSVKSDFNAKDSIDRVIGLFENWVKYGDRDLENVTHNISNTITVKEDEWDGVVDLLFSNRNKIGGISLLGEFGDKDYPYAPMCSVMSDEEYKNSIKDEKNDKLSEHYFELIDGVFKYGWDFYQLTSLMSREEQLLLKEWYAHDMFEYIENTYNRKVSWSDLKSDDKENVGNIAATACSGGNCTIL